VLVAAVGEAAHARGHQGVQRRRQAAEDGAAVEGLERSEAHDGGSSRAMRSLGHEPILRDLPPRGIDATFCVIAHAYQLDTINRIYE
jgi:hypothetical protein